MGEVVGACVSQFHDDANSFELLLAFSDGREVGHSVSRSALTAIATELVQEVGHAAKDAEIARLREALKPFADIAGEAWADENGWTDAACQKDRVCDWFGPSAFLAARLALKEQADV